MIFLHIVGIIGLLFVGYMIGYIMGLRFAKDALKAKINTIDDLLESDHIDK